MSNDPKPSGAAAEPSATTPVQGSETRSVRISLRAVIALGAAFILFLGGVLVWKSRADDYQERFDAAQRKIEALDQTRKTEVAAASAGARQALDARVEDLLRLSAVPLAWAIRADLIVGNLQRIEGYMNEFSRESLVSGVVLADAKGKIVLATDKAVEKQKFDAVYPLEYLGIESPTMRRDERGGYRLIVPIMGLSARAGTLVVVYTSIAVDGPPK